jgi:drug/metabolite transporter (DMT)-like permease
VLAALALAIVGMSCAAPLVRLSTSAPLTIAFWRMLLSLVAVAIALVAGGSWREWRGVRARDLEWCAAAGGLLALHFWSWNASLRLTSVAASVVLVSLQPVIVLPLAARWLNEHTTREQRSGILVAVCGAAIIAAGDGVTSLLGGFQSARALTGDLLAIVGAATGAGYYLIGRRMRATLSLWPYVAIVYTSCALVLALAAGATGAPLWAVEPREFAIFAGLALGPMLLGHTGLNWALGHAPASLVNVAVLGEPVGATVLAWLLPGIAERPPWSALLGGGLVLAGLVLTTRHVGTAGRRTD